MNNIDFNNKMILAPMAGITDLPFRLLCKEQGCDILYSEMISAKAILYHNKNTKPLLMFDKKEHPIGVQLFGAEPKIMAEIAKQVEGMGFDFIDVNMGCPVPKIVNNGEGSALMKTPALIGQIVESMVRAADLPITVKIRKGFEEANAVEVAKVIEESGGYAVAVHGRLRTEYYQGKADWDIIRQVKEQVKIPVIGNGDLFTAQDVIEMKRLTNCDSFMIARGARGNPFIFHQMKQYFETGSIVPKPELPEVIDMVLRHMQMMVEIKGEFTGIREMRKHIAWYTKGFLHSSKLRNEINQIETYEQLKEMFVLYSKASNFACQYTGKNG